MDRLIETLQGTLGASLPGVAGALLILLVGWLVAIGVRAVVKKAASFLKLNDRLISKSPKVDVETAIASGSYYVLLLVTLLAVFNQLGLEVASQPIQVLLTELFKFVPKLIGGAVLILIAWVCATVVRQVTSSALSTTGLDAKIKTGDRPFSAGVGEVLYWFVFLFFLPAILGVFELTGLLAPVQTMMSEITGMLPNILAAGLIVFIGWFVAKVFGDLVTNLVSVTGFDALGEKVGLKGGTSLSHVAGIFVYLFVFIPAIIAGLGALQITAISDPATQMLNTVMSAIPQVLAAVAILVITYFVARAVTGIIRQLCTAANFDIVPEKLGFPKKVLGGTLSDSIATLVFFFMMLFATVEAANRLGFHQFSELVTTFITFGGQVVLGCLIIVIGLWISNLVHSMLSRTGAEGGNPVAGIVRLIILALVFAMGLRAMGLANDIVNMAFGITLGAVAIAFAIAFGLGGREAAGRQMEEWMDAINGKGSKKK